MVAVTVAVEPVIVAEVPMLQEAGGVFRLLQTGTVDVFGVLVCAPLAICHRIIHPLRMGPERRRSKKSRKRRDDKPG